MRRLFPFVDWFKDYTSSTFRADLVAGTTVGLVLVPQSMAYAQLAGLPTYYGLYAAFLPPTVAVLFGSSRQLATGPVAIVSLMTATALGPLATAGSQAYVAYAVLLALLVGLFQLVLGLVRMGMLVNFLSHPVVNGFTNAAALIIASSQLSSFFGVSVDAAEHHYETVWNVLLAIRRHAHWGTLGMGVLAFAIMWGLKQLNPRIPNVLVAVVLTVLLSWAIGFERNSVTGIAHIHSSAVEARIDEYNGALQKIQDLSEVRVEISPQKVGKNLDYTYSERSRVCLSCHSALEVGDTNLNRPTALIHRRHDMDLLDFELQDLREEVRDIRAELRAFQFRAVREDQGQPTFYLKGEVPPEQKADRRTWSLKVGTGPLSKEALTLVGGGAVVGTIPQGLPQFAVPKLNFHVILNLLIMAVTISLLGFMEAISIAKAMATRTSQRLDYNQELIGQGLANIVGSFAWSFPVSGSFSRSAVNLQAGAVTGLSNVFSSVVIVLTLLFFTPVLYHLPKSVLAAIIMMAVISLVNIRGFIHCWRAQKYDGAISVITFFSTLAFAPHLDRGIMIGVLLSLVLYLLRHMKPDIAMLARDDDGTFRDLERRGLTQCKYIAVIRFPSSLFFANVNHLEEKILESIATMPDLRHILIVGNGINELDASGEGMLSRTVKALREAGYDFSMSGLNDSVLDVMRRTGLYERIGEDHLYRNASMAIEGIFEDAHAFAEDYDVQHCPLKEAIWANSAIAKQFERPPSSPGHATAQTSNEGQERLPARDPEGHKPTDIRHERETPELRR